MKHYILIGFALCAPALIISPAAQANDIMYLLQSRAGMEETRAPTPLPYRYTMYLNLSEHDSDGPRDVQAEVRVDPSKPAGSRTRIVSSSRGHRKVLTEFLAEIENPKTDMAALADDFWCTSIHDNEDVDLSTYTVVSQTDTEAVLKPNLDILSDMLLRKDTNDTDKFKKKMKKKLMNDRVEGQIIVSKRNGGTKGFQTRMTRSATLKTIVKFQTMTLEQSCAVAPNGYRYKSEMNYSMSGNALGETFGADHDIRISDLTPLPSP